MANYWKCGASFTLRSQGTKKVYLVTVRSRPSVIVVDLQLRVHVFYVTLVP